VGELLFISVIMSLISEGGLETIKLVVFVNGERG
jgi:hypothetical protein